MILTTTCLLVEAELVSTSSAKINKTSNKQTLTKQTFNTFKKVCFSFEVLGRNFYIIHLQLCIFNNPFKSVHWPTLFIEKLFSLAITWLICYWKVALCLDAIKSRFLNNPFISLIISNTKDRRRVDATPEAVLSPAK